MSSFVSWSSVIGLSKNAAIAAGLVPTLHVGISTTALGIKITSSTIIPASSSFSVNGVPVSGSNGASTPARLPSASNSVKAVIGSNL